MKFELIPVGKIPISNRKRVKRERKFDELEIAYIKRITGKDIRPSIRR